MPRHALTFGHTTHEAGIIAVALIALLVCSSPSVASSVASAPASDKVGESLQKTSKPEWRSLTSAQQTALQPLAGKWQTLGEGQKRKWIAISANYGSLAPAEQVKLHSRMTEWVSLSPQQRAQARLNFAQSKQLTADQRAATWNAYNALSVEKKEELARSAQTRTPGAAPAPKPVQPQKLAKVPSSSPASKVAKVDPLLDQKTLLPKPATEAPAPLKN